MAEDLSDEDKPLLKNASSADGDPMAGDAGEKQSQVSTEVQNVEREEDARQQENQGVSQNLEKDKSDQKEVPSEPKGGEKEKEDRDEEIPATPRGSHQCKSSRISKVSSPRVQKEKEAQ